MHVRILQGNDTGLVQDVCQSEGENMLTTGFAELAPLETPPPVVPLEAAEPELPPAPAPQATDLGDDDDPVSEEPHQEGVPGRLRKPRAKKQVAPATRRRKRR